MQPEKQVKSNSRSNCCSYTFRKLFTKEDPHFLHKFFGFPVLLSFLYRYVVVYPRTGNLGFDGSLLDHLSIFWHFMLSTSSLIFRVPNHRIKKRPTIIWNEYRLHAIVFTVGAVSLYVLRILLPWQPSSQVPWLNEYYAFILTPYVLLQNVAADLVTKFYGPKDKKQTTVRVNVQHHEGWMQHGILFYSFYQIAARGAVLTPSLRGGDLGFNAFIAIQSSAFLMTLVKKGILPWYAHMVGYALALCVSYFHIYVVMAIDQPLFWARVMLVAFFRFQFRVSKYILWLCYAVLTLPAIDAVLRAQLETISFPMGLADASLSIRAISIAVLVMMTIKACRTVMSEGMSNLRGWYPSLAIMGYMYNKWDEIKLLKA